MKKNYSFLQFLLAVLFSLSFSASAFCGITSNDSLYPPANFRADSLRTLVTWDYPSITLLNEDFESCDSLPAGWTTSTAGNSAWYVTDNAISMNLFILPHTKYAATNDFNAGQQNDGCCDYLVAPAVNLTLTDSAVLAFATRYTGAFNQAAYIELSVDNGASWQVIDTIEPNTSYNYGSWKQVTVNLSAYAGSGGCSSAVVRFHADDNGQQASGWAVDDIKIMAYVTTLEYYTLWLNDFVLATVDSNSYQIDQELLVFGQQYKIEIAAVYTNGTSPHDSVIFTNHYLPYPGNLQAEANDNAAIISWDSPDFGNTGLEPWMMYYLLYCNGALIDTISASDTEYWHLNLDPGFYCYMLSAVYLLQPLGFPGQTGESFVAGPVCADIFYCCTLPIDENWTSGSFSLGWEHGDNWVIDENQGQDSPCVRFNGSPVLEDYESALEVFPPNFSQRTATPHIFYLQFDLALNDSTASGTESLEFMYKISFGEWKSLAVFTNQGDLAWNHYYYEFSVPEQSGVFSFKIVARGQQSSSVSYWLIDNIYLSIKYFFNPVYNLIATPSNSNPFIINLEWNSPVDSLNLKSAAATEDLLEYRIFRRALYPQPGEWAEIGATTKTWYADDSLAPNCYDYYVKAFYSEGALVTSNIDSLNCIVEGVEEPEHQDFRLYPNPADDFLYWEADHPVKVIRIIDQAGRMLCRETSLTGLKGRIVTSALADGLYLVCFTGSDGKQVIKKFIVSGK